MSHRTKHMQASGEWRPDQTPSRLSVQFTGRRLIAGTYFKNSRGCLIFTIKIFICQIVLLVVLKTTSLPCRTVWLIHRGTWEIFNRSDIQSLFPRSGIRPSSQVNKRVFVGLHDWIRQMSPSWRVVHLWFWSPALRFPTHCLSSSAAKLPRRGHTSSTSIYGVVIYQISHRSRLLPHYQHTPTMTPFVPYLNCNFLVRSWPKTRYKFNSGDIEKIFVCTVFQRWLYSQSYNRRPSFLFNAQFPSFESPKRYGIDDGQVFLLEGSLRAPTRQWICRVHSTRTRMFRGMQGAVDERPRKVDKGVAPYRTSMYLAVKPS